MKLLWQWKRKNWQQQQHHSEWCWWHQQTDKYDVYLLFLLLQYKINIVINILFFSLVSVVHLYNCYYFFLIDSSEKQKHTHYVVVYSLLSVEWNKINKIGFPENKSHYFLSLYSGNVYQLTIFNFHCSFLVPYYSIGSNYTFFLSRAAGDSGTFLEIFCCFLRNFPFGRVFIILYCLFVYYFALRCFFLFCHFSDKLEIWYRFHHFLASL